MPCAVAARSGTETGHAAPDSAAFLALLRHDAATAMPSGETRRMADRFVAATVGGPKFLLGRNEHAAALLTLGPVDGIIDDYAGETTWKGCAVVRSADVPKDAIVVNCAMSISPRSALRRLQDLGLQGCLNYCDLQAAHPEAVAAPGFVRETRADIAEHRAHWSALFERLADQQSRKVLGDVVRYRLTADPLCMDGYSVRFSEQYFEDFLRLRRETFVDAGGYDGDTTAEFCRRHPDYARVILFEPSARNMRAARERLAGLRDIEFVERGLSDGPGALWFNPDAGSASAVVRDGACRIDVTSLDAAVAQPVSFIKMDLEGWEMQALAGAERHIRADRPKMALSVYHAAADFWRIPEFILGLRADYDVFLRHYTEGWSETVMFFVPRP